MPTTILPTALRVFMFLMLLSVASCINSSSIDHTDNSPLYDDSRPADTQVREALLMEEWYLVNYSDSSPNPVTLNKREVYIYIYADHTYAQNIWGEEERGKWFISDDGQYLQLKYFNGGGIDILIKDISEHKLTLVREGEKLELFYERAVG